MLKLGNSIVFSPSDLNHFLECEHLIQLDRTTDGEAARVRDSYAELLATKGLEHERRWLETFRSQGHRIVSIDRTPGERDWQSDAERTRAAMQDGVDLIYQGVFVDGVWHGVSDFLVRVARPSKLGGWSYVAWDTKLARQSKPYFVLQLCFYTEQIARLQGIEPDSMTVVLGTGQPAVFEYRDFAAYYRAVRQRFLASTLEERVTSPYPVSHCSLCHHATTCERHWQSEDHPSLVAGIRREQVERLNEVGVTTVGQLARFDTSRRVAIGHVAVHRLVQQAALQTSHRTTGEHRYELLPVDAQNGFRLLPAPSPGDVFFDMEGYPFYDPARGLEYLFGFMTIDSGEPRFHGWHASDPAEEKETFERFVDFIQARLQQWPDLHVYHYAAYEQTALKRLMSQHATREEAMDDLLRREVFVDLYQVVRQSLRISHPSYSIKAVRTFFMSDAGQGTVADAGQSIVEFERYLRTGDREILDGIVRYNEEDCLSTVKLLEWLLERKREAECRSGTTIPWKVAEPMPLTPEREQEDEKIRARRERLLARGDDTSKLLAHLLNYHRREARPEWWAYFERQKKSLDDLLEDTEAIAYLEPLAGAAPALDKRSLVHTLTFPPQEFKIGVDDPVDDPFDGRSAGTIVWLDAATGRLGLKRGPTLANDPLPLAIGRGRPIREDAQRGALCRVADAVLGDSPEFAAARALLANEPPRLRGLTTAAACVEALDNGYLFIQGPPGSGKTWTGARLIVSLVSKGKRVGVSATSHKAIHNLLEEVEAVAACERVSFRGLKKSSGSEETEFHGALFENTDDPKACEASTAQLIAGTAWLFARAGMQQALDYLFIDEAGQVSLADGVAMSTAARNVVLLGDPQQLPHVTHGVHPEGSGRSVLRHLLGEERTVSDERGIFLERSWRMHPDVCRFVSELAYDGRLGSAGGCDRQRVESSGASGSGLRYFPVEHVGNVQQSPEEARVVGDEVRRLLRDGVFCDSSGHTRRMTHADILVVAPYNMQVRCLRETLPEGVQVGTVDKFQGREAPVVFFSMASSSGDDVPRGLEFLFNRNRLNVAVSRAKCLSILVCSPRLLEARCRTVEQMRLVNALCRFVESARTD